MTNFDKLDDDELIHELAPFSNDKFDGDQCTYYK